MKYNFLITLIALFIMFCFGCCTPKNISFDNVITSKVTGQDVFYYKNKKYTGTILKSEIGILREKISVKKGLKDGVNEEYLSDGSLISITTYRKGVKNGLYEFYLDENICDRYYFKDGLIDGKYNVYYEDGTISISCDYVKGEKHGEERDFNRAGNLITLVQYSRNKEHGKFILYYDNSQPRFSCNYSDGLKNGKYEYYYENGDLWIEGSYDKDKKEGRFTHYHQGGNLNFFAEYYDDKLISRSPNYNQKGKKTNERYVYPFGSYIP